MNTITLRHRNVTRTFNLNDLSYNQFDKLRYWIVGQIKKIHNRMARKPAIPLAAMCKLTHILAKLHGDLDTITNYLSTH